MIPALVLPALAALVAGVPAAGPHRRLHPRLGARALAVVTAALALAVTAALATVAVGFVSGIPGIAEYVGWCRDVARTHDRIPPWIGIPALATLGAMAAIGTRAYRRARQTLWAQSGAGAEVRVLDDDRPDAYAMAGSPGHIVVSAGMLRLLDSRERQVVLAHERSHLRHRHHRYIALALVVDAALPVLGFLTRRLRLAVERWADEDAAAEVGDRHLVARAVIRAALARTYYPATPRLGLGLLGVPARVDALLLPAPEPVRGPVSAVVAVPGAALAVLVGSALQLHHLIGFASHVCGL